ncbi:MULTISPECIES: ABC transporter permease [Aneurinibacillus]|uniref:ABC transporter permease n=1 Tax=Aneurinibacillus thermoaerophilus TaxID=143495 RepID=A0ABX8YB08_ANETH|nr:MULTISPECIES: ABC transporter permease [Aneurinibacillus]AMA71554.1 hypothetical protein ACH33_01025 [Aneurinibacillus sp. XH2]MED0735421.1 ABC transporter permease [Aneurinibacillus thermoaerophilus]QYY42696.1 ABC transporter permease [Aneurinibacillus thermoaerophilus]
MYGVLQVLWLRMRLILQDKMFLVLLLLFPVLFVFILGATQSFRKEPVIPVAVADEDNSEYSRLIVDRFARKEGIRVLRVTSDEAYRLVENYRVEAAFVIQKGFQDAVLEEETDKTIKMVKNPGSLSYGILGEMLGSEVMRLSANTGAANRAEEWYRLYGLTSNEPERLWERVWKYADSQWTPKPLMTINYKEMEAGGVQSVTRLTRVSVAALTGIGALLVFMMMFVALHSRWLIEERENGTLKRMMSVPGMFRTFYLGNIAMLFTLSVFLAALCEAVARFWFDASLLYHPLQSIILGAYILAVIGLSMLFATLLPTPQQLQTTAPLLALLTGFVGGCFWPFLPLNGWIKTLSLLTPQGWALDGMKALLVNDYSIGQVTQTAGTLAGIGVFLLVWSFYVIRYRVFAG